MTESLKDRFSDVKRFVFSHSRTVAAVLMVLISALAAVIIFGEINFVSIEHHGMNVGKAYTLSTDVTEIMDDAGVGENYEVLSTVTDGNKLTIRVLKNFNVYVTYNGKTVTVVTEECTAEEAIKKAGFTLADEDTVNIPRDTLLSGNTYIDVVHVEPKKEPEKPKPEPNHNLKDNDSPLRTDGSVMSTLVPDIDIDLDENGIPVNYSRAVTVQATAYTYTGHRCSTGVPPQPGYIAVNPKVIPYGTKMFIVSEDGRYNYGYAIAADTGGFAKTQPTNVDLFMETRTECINFGRRNVRIYFLE